MKYFYSVYSRQLCMLKESFVNCFVSGPLVLVSPVYFPLKLVD